MKKIGKFFITTFVAATLFSGGCSSQISGVKGGERGFSYLEMEKIVEDYYKEFNTLHLTVNGHKKERRTAECVIRDVTRSVAGAYAGLRTEWGVDLLRECRMDTALLSTGVLVMSNCTPALSGTQDGLAYVIAHTMAHTLLEHDNVRVTKLITPSMEASKNKDEKFSLSKYLREGENYDEFTRALGLTDSKGRGQPYTPEQEKQADVLALQMMSMSGFNPSAALIFWHNQKNSADVRTGAFSEIHPHSDADLKALSETLFDFNKKYQTARKDYGRIPQCEFK